jgi:hypothetical protein
MTSRRSTRIADTESVVIENGYDALMQQLVAQYSEGLFSIAAPVVATSTTPMS